MPSITLKNVQFTNVKDKRQGLKMSNILTQSNVGSLSVANYINSENFYKLVSALDIAWGDISVGNGVIISDTADLINWISSLPASGGGGKSAYELYVEEEEGKGNTPLSLSEWLESLQGQQGIAGVSPHIDPSTGNWFIGETNTGVHAQGIDGSQGPLGIQGIQGKSNYELYLETVPQGETPLTQLEWLDSLKGLNGTNGINGTDGTDGKSAYEIYVDHVPNGSTVLTEEEWLASLKGKDGKDGNRGLTGESAYEIYFRNTLDPLSEEEWLASLKGADGTMSFEELTDELRASLVGETGPAGPSAYQSYRNTTTDVPILTEEEWIASLHGQTGADGTTPHIDASTKHWFIGNTDTNILAEGVNGQDGQPGADGSNGITPHIDQTTGNWFIGETDTEVHAQGIPGIDGSNGITPHIDASTGNWFIGETNTGIHAQGETGQSGADGITPHIDASTGNWFIGETNTGIPAQGPIGQNGADGSTGKSAYELYIDGIQEGEPLSQEDWLASLKGDEGKSAYEVAVSNGFDGTEQQWLDSLLPTINTDPSSNNASDIYWFIKGEKTQYRAIPQIISITSAAYEALQEKDETAIYVITDSQYNQDNEVAYRIGNITPTTDMNNLDVSVRRSNNVVYFDFTLPIANLDVSNLTEAQATLLRGKSNYQIYVDNHDVDLDGPLLTEEQWLATLKGEVGNDGKSAYELYTENYISTHGDDTGMLTESEWLNSLIPQIVKDSSDNLYWHINNQKTQYRAFPGIQFLTLDEYDALETKEDDVVYIIDNDKDATTLTFNIGNVTTSALETDASVNIRRIDNSIYFDFVLPFSIDSSEYKGESAYEIYRRNASTGEVLSETAWINSLKGKSAYELFAAANPTSVYTNESQWLASLKGETGKDGSQGPQGPMPTITINQEGNWVVNDQVMQSALGRLPEIRNGLYIDPETGDELGMKTWWINGVDTNVPTSLGVDVTTLLNKIGTIGNAQEFEPSTYYTAEDEEVIGGTKEVGELKTPAVAAVPHTVKSYVDNAVANVHVNIDASNIYTKSEVDQKFEDLIGQAPETLDTLKEIADKLSDEDTSLGQLNAVLLNKADTSTTYTKSEVDTLYNNINSSLNNYVLLADLDDTEKVIAAALVQLNESVTNIDASIVNIRQNSGSVKPNDLSIYELKADLVNDLSIYTSKAYVDQKFEDLIGQAPETLDTLKEIADKLSDEDTSLGQLNAVLLNKADTSTTYTKSEVDALILPADWDNNDLESSLFIKNKPFGTYKVTKYNESNGNNFQLNNQLGKTAEGHLSLSDFNYTDLSNDLSNTFRTANNRFIVYVKGKYAGIYKILYSDTYDAYYTDNYDFMYNKPVNNSKYEWAFKSYTPNLLSIAWLDINDVYTTVEKETFTLSDFVFYFLDNNGDTILNTPIESKYVNINNVISDKAVPAEDKPFGEIFKNIIIDKTDIYNESELTFNQTGPTHGGVSELIFSEVLLPGDIIILEVDGEDYGAAEVISEPNGGSSLKVAGVGDYVSFPFKTNWSLIESGSAYMLAINDANNNLKSGTHSLKISKAIIGKADDIKKIASKYIDYNSYIEDKSISDSEKPFGEYYYYTDEEILLETNATPNSVYSFYPWKETNEYYPTPLQEGDKVNIYIDDVLLFTYIIPTNFNGKYLPSGLYLVGNSTYISSIYIIRYDSPWKYEVSTEYKVTMKIQHRLTGIKTLDAKYIPSSLLSNYVTVADISANEYVIASALVELNSNKADKDTTYTKTEIDTIIENLGTGVDPNDLSIYQLKSELSNDLSIYELKSDLTNDLSIYELKDDLTNDLSIYELKSDLANDLSIYVLNSSLIEIEEVISGAISSLNTNKVDVSALNDYVQKTALENSEKVIAAALVLLNESVTNIDASIISIKQNGTGGTINPNDLSIYELKADLANDLSIYTSKTYVDQKFDDLINNAPATLDTLKEIADKLSDEDTSLGQLNAILAVKADTSTTYTKSEVDTLYNNINSSLNYYVLNSSLIDVEEVVAESITQLNDALDELSGNVYTKDEIDNLVISSNDLSIYELKSELTNDLSIYQLKSELSNDLSIYELKSELTNDLSIYQLKSELSNDLSIYVLKTDLEDTEKVIATALIQINDSITTIDASIVDIKQNGSGNSGINSSVLDDYVLKTYIGTLPNKTDNIYYTQEEITNASVGDNAYGKTTADIKIPATQYIDLMEAIQEDEEVTAAAIVDMNSKVTDISTRLDNIVTGPAIWVGTQSQYNSLESIDQTTIYIIKADEV